MAGTCPACGRKNDDDALFCESCGARLSTACAACGAQLAPDAAFCKSCGAPAPAAPADAAPEVAAASGGQMAGATVAAAAQAAQTAAPVPPPPAQAAPPAAPSDPGRGAPTWLIVLIVLAVVAVVVVLGAIFVTRGSNDGGGDKTATPVAGTTASSTPKPALDQFLAAAVGPRADRLAAIAADGSAKPIMNFSGKQIWQIAYSPDGKWLACIAGSYKRSQLWLFDTASGAARQATADTPNIVAIDSIAWLSAEELLVAGFTEPPKATGQNADLLVYDPSAQSFTPLLDSGGVALRGVAVSASRDGAKIAFVTYTDVKSNSYGMVTANERLEVLDRGSGTITELGKNKALFDVNARAFDAPLISPSGDAIIYRRAGSDVGTSYTVLGTDGTTLMPAKETQMPAGYAWDPGGTKVVFTGHSLQPSNSASGVGPAIFWLYDTEAGGGAQTIARYKDTMVQNISWSPDGESIAWAEYDPKKEWRTGDVFVMSASGGDSEVLVNEALSPVWAPGAAVALQTSPSSAP